jgi:hypothetical protein
VYNVQKQYKQKKQSSREVSLQLVGQKEKVIKSSIFNRFMNVSTNFPTVALGMASTILAIISTIYQL